MLIARSRIQRDFKVISKFRTDNSLQLNADKTKCLPLIEFAPLANEVRNLGVIFDMRLRFRYHGGEVSKSGFFHLRRLKCLQKLYPPTA